MSENQETVPAEKKETIKISGDSWHHRLTSGRDYSNVDYGSVRSGKVSIGEYLINHILPSSLVFAAKTIGVIVTLFVVLTTIGIATALIGTAIYQTVVYLWALIPAGVAVWKWVTYPLAFIVGLFVTYGFFDSPDDIIDFIAALPNLIFSVALTAITVTAKVLWTIAGGLGAKRLFTFGPLKELAALWSTPIEFV